MIGTHGAGTVRTADVGREVVLAGWVARRREHAGVVFVDLRDATGVVQVVLRDAGAAHRLRAEFCLRVAGEVVRRPEGSENPKLLTGEVEVLAAEVEVLSESAPLPFPVTDGGDRGPEIAEEVRLRYRYLDLRREGPARALRLRSRVTRTIREVMDAAGFLDIETPYLTRSTPEGARDFLVPVRLQPGTWYALPQSPQLFKQLLMVAGMERYYQIVRCFRDEDFRADRQPEFTQLDVEMSFPDEEDVLALSEQLMVRLWAEVHGVALPTPFPRLTYADAMARYGSDKPDLRFATELVDLSAYFAGTQFRVLSAPYVGAVVMPGGAEQTRRELDDWQAWAKARGARGLAYVLFDAASGEPRGPLARHLSAGELEGLPAATGARPGDALFFAAGERRASQEVLGAARLEVAKRCALVDESRWEFVWVVEAPLFERTDDGWTSVHHPFTAPMPEWEERFVDEPGAALARAYDLVLNGTEIGGGSIRIHRPEVQQRVFDVLGLSRQQAEDKFGFLLEAFRYGPPPHGGIAFGLDRLVALLGRCDSIREVIAFPKTSSGTDSLTGAPTPITAAQRKEAGVDAPPPSTAHTPVPNEPGSPVRPDTRRN